MLEPTARLAPFTLSVATAPEAAASAKRLRDLARRAAERDPAAPPRDLLDRETLRLQPRDDAAKVAFAEAEAFPVLLGSQPVPVIGR